MVIILSGPYTCPSLQLHSPVLTAVFDLQAMTGVNRRLIQSAKIDHVASFQGANAERDAASKYIRIREEESSDDSAGVSPLLEYKG